MTALKLINKNKMKSVLLSDSFTKAHSVIQIITMFSWLMILQYTDAYYLVYLTMGIIGFCCRCVINNDKKALFKKVERTNVIISAVFSFFIILANYNLYENMLQAMITLYEEGQVFRNHIHFFSVCFFILFFPFVFLGGFYITYFILKYVSEKIVPFVWQNNPRDEKQKNYVIFAGVFLLFCVFYSSILLLCFYPGVTTFDSVFQLKQIIYDQYSKFDLPDALYPYTMAKRSSLVFSLIVTT